MNNWLFELTMKIMNSFCTLERKMPNFKKYIFENIFFTCRIILSWPSISLSQFPSLMKILRSLSKRSIAISIYSSATYKKTLPKIFWQQKFWLIKNFLPKCKIITLVHGNKAMLKRPSKSNFEIFEPGLIALQIELSLFELDLSAVPLKFLKFQTWPYCSWEVTSRE